MIAVFSFVGVLLIFIGLVVHKYKLYNLIAGYNTMSDEEKSQFDIKRYARVFGIVFYVMGIGIIVCGLVFYTFHLDQNYLVLPFVVVVLGGVVYLNVFGQTMKRRSRQS